MPDRLKEYTPSPKSKAILDQLSATQIPERADKLIEFWKNSPYETQALIDGFHYLIQTGIESRETEDPQPPLTLPNDLVYTVIKSMKEHHCYFSYDWGDGFFHAIAEFVPPVLQNPAPIRAAITTFFPPRPKVNPEFGFPSDYEPSVFEKCKEICQKAEEAFKQVNHFKPSMQAAQKIAEEYKNLRGDYTPMDFQLARETFKESKTNYLQHAKVISDGMPYVHQAYQLYTDQLQLYRLYKQYLAILLASREAKYPVENYVAEIAKQKFDYTIPNFDVSEEEKLRGITGQQKFENLKEELELDIRRLESRFRKRRLMVQMNQGVPMPRILKELSSMAETDPDDIRTHILLARLCSDYSAKIANHQQRRVMRDKALNHCKLAFARIDAFLDLQKIEKVQERDKQRASFVKTISDVRIPLIKGK